MDIMTTQTTSGTKERVAGSFGYIMEQQDFKLRQLVSPLADKACPQTSVLHIHDYSSPTPRRGLSFVGESPSPD